MVEKSGIEKFTVEEFIVDKSGVEKFLLVLGMKKSVDENFQG